MTVLISMMIVLLALVVVAALAVGATFAVLPRLLREQREVQVLAARLAAEAEVDALTRATLLAMRRAVTEPQSQPLWGWTSTTSVPRVRP